ncbi:MAG: hypothetical protein JSS10_00310 [Verrucomicrobia bacterium]|nr:hypothetical protein [Verrucomicrobiota bacterium]
MEIAQELFAKGDYLKEGYASALSHCEDALNSKRGDLREIHLLQAQIYFALRQNNKAMQICQSLALQPLADQPLLAAEIYLLLGNIWQRECNGLDYALQQYNTAWGCLLPNDPRVPARLKVEILIGKSLAIAKKEADYKTASSTLRSAVGIAEEYLGTKASPALKDIQLLSHAYYCWAFLLLLADQPRNALVRCKDALDPLQTRSNDQELNLKAQILLLKALIHEEKGDRDDAAAAVATVFDLDPPPMLLDPGVRQKEIEVSDKEVVAAAYFLRARYTENTDDKITSFTKALENVENDDSLKALIQCERGYAYLQKARSGNSADSFRKAQEDFNILPANTKLYNPARNDLWQALIKIGKLENLHQRIQEGLAALGEQSSPAV